MRGASERRRVLLLGYLVRGPMGGLAWHHLQYVVGLARLGHDVMFLEVADSEGWDCYDPSQRATVDDPTFGLRWVARLFDRVGLADRWVYFDRPRQVWHGPMASQAEKYCRSADIVLNLSALHELDDMTMSPPVRVLVDTDPVFTQVRHLSDSSARANAARHTAFLTFAEEVHRGATIPDDGFPWLPTRQPVVMDLWPATTVPVSAALTTVMQWSSYPSVEYGGRHYGMKGESLARIIDLPRRVNVPLEIALGSPDAPKSRLADAGWIVRDPLEVTRDAWTFQHYIESSLGEFSVAKHGYVISRSGWFSERSANYLASGRPVIAQDTGFSVTIPTGAGLLAFSTEDEAVAAIEEVIARPEHHGRIARELAQSEFASHLVLPRLLDDSAS